MFEENLRVFPDKATAEEAAGQFLIAGFDGTRYTHALGSWFSRLRPAGIILFSRNIENKEQTARLVSDLEKLAEDVTGLPLFVCVDQEGGRVSRFPREYPKFPTARALSEDGSGELVEKTYADMGAALREMGFNVDFAPVLDLDTNSENPIIGDRSFGANPEIVAALGRSAIRGLRSRNILTCAKHFPGHGDTALDSHLDLPVDGRPAARFRDVELFPFRAAVEDGVEFIMTAHVIYTSFDRDHPATLSKKIVTDLLRHETGYKGVIISDDMDMKAIADRWGDEEAAALAYNAGCDIALACRDANRQEKIYETARRMILEGELDEKDVRERMGRIMNLKTKLARSAA